MALAPVNQTQQVISRVPVIDLNRLGGKKSTKKGQLMFVPLVDMTTQTVGKTPLTSASFKFFNYLFMKPNPEDATKVKFQSVRWIDTGLRISDNDPYNDPGVDLGLALKQDERCNIPGFGVPSGGYPDSDSVRYHIRIPVLIITEGDLNVKGCVTPGAGQFAMLDLKQNQWKDIVELFAPLTAASEVSYRREVNGTTERAFYDYPGYGYVVKLDKDSSRKMDTYMWTRLDSTIRKEDVESRLPDAEKELHAYIDNVMKYNGYTQVYVDELNAGKIDYKTACTKIVFKIQHELLKAWGVDFEDTVEGVMRRFAEVLPTYSLKKGSGLTSNIVETKRLTLNGSDDDEVVSAEPF